MNQGIKRIDKEDGSITIFTLDEFKKEYPGGVDIFNSAKDLISAIKRGQVQTVSSIFEYLKE